MKNFINDFLAKELDNYLHKNPTTADSLKKRIEQSERERKELAGIKKLANERAKKANLHNKKLRDCRFHYNDEATGKDKEAILEKQKESTIFITEGDSASGSITKARDVERQVPDELDGDGAPETGRHVITTGGRVSVRAAGHVAEVAGELVQGGDRLACPIERVQADRGAALVR